MLQKKITLGDILACGCVLLAAFLLVLPPLFSSDHGELLVVTTPEGSFSYQLNEPREIVFYSNGVTMTVRIADRGACVLESDCRDGVCKNSGRISRPGETILCAPAGIVLTVKGGGESVDFVAG